MSNELPPLPEKTYLGDDAEYGYDGVDMHEYAREALAAAQERIEALEAENAKLIRVRILLNEVISNHCIAMQSAVIEMHIGRGAQAGMRWIENTLVGPGLYPDVDGAQALGGAQAWFDAKTDEEAKRVAALTLNQKEGQTE